MGGIKGGRENIHAFKVPRQCPTHPSDTVAFQRNSSKLCFKNQFLHDIEDTLHGLPLTRAGELEIIFPRIIRSTYICHVEKKIYSYKI
jgi:hypothetical protein